MKLAFLCVVNLSLALCAVLDKGPSTISAESSPLPTNSSEPRAQWGEEEVPNGPVPQRNIPIRQCVGSIAFKSQGSSMFYGSLLGSYRSLGEQSCANLCYEHPYCETANYIEENHVCELNSETRSTHQNWYRHKTGVAMIEDVRCDAGAQGTCGLPPIEPRLNSASIGYAINPTNSFALMTEVRPNSFPWLVSIQRDRQHVCSGVLISEYDVLTSASCFSRGGNPSAYQAIMGGHSAKSPNPGQQTSQVAAVAIHDQYKPAWSRENDIALVRLQRSAWSSPNSNIRPACVPPSVAVFPELCVTVGWGRISGAAAVDELSEIVTPPIRRQVCNQPEWYNDQVKESMLCAGYSQAMPCQADVGGPLLCQLNGTWSVYGVGSWGEGCARSFKPMVYTNVPYFASWVRSKITTQ
uniref:Uncharacterized protein n=1 Tax=Plectus sambesii TaxID=2011161 RepID=A0A914USJ0_9BILA